MNIHNANPIRGTDSLPLVEDQTVYVKTTFADTLLTILTLVKIQTGHDFLLYKTNTTLRRIQKRLDILQINSLSDYLDHIQRIPSEIEILCKELMIRVTSFFLNPTAYEVLKKHLSKQILTDQSNASDLRIWIPACATGEEAYSIAMIAHECMDSLKRSCKVQIFATDIDSDAISSARSGLYPNSIKTNITANRLQRFFTQENGSYRITDNLRKMVRFSTQNIIKDPPFNRLDFISCRNLLMYLSSPTQKELLSLFHYNLKPAGLLFLGIFDYLGRSSNLFNVLEKNCPVFEKNQRKKSDNPIRRIFYKDYVQRNNGREPLGKIMNNVAPQLSHTIKNILLKNYTPSGVVIDEDSHIVYLNGSTNKYLQLPSGEIRYHLIDMIRPELRSTLKKTIRKALEEKKEIILSNLHLKIDAQIEYIDIIVRPIFINGEPSANKLLLILFKENQSPKFKKERLWKKIRSNINTQLEKELTFINHNLQSTIQELEIRNEDLKLNNNELQSINEELQSANEEIETTKEELQSLNDELTTINTELDSRIEQLSSANDDIETLIDNTEIATLFLDKNLCIKHFTPKTTDIINLIRTDIGRPISDISSNLTYENLISDARKVLKTLQPTSSEAVDKLNNWYMIRIIPCRTVSNIVDGVVITFLNIHDQKKIKNKMNLLEKDLSEAKAFYDVILNSIPSSAIMLRGDGRIILANHHFSIQFKIQDKIIENQSIYDLNLGWDNNNFKKFINEVLPEQLIIKNYPLQISSTKMARITAHMITFQSILLILN